MAPNENICNSVTICICLRIVTRCADCASRVDGAALSDWIMVGQDFRLIKVNVVDSQDTLRQFHLQIL